MKVWHWRIYYKDFDDELITDRALGGVWLSRNTDEDTVQDEIHDYLAEGQSIDPEGIYKFNLWEDDDKYEFG